MASKKFKKPNEKEYCGWQQVSIFLLHKKWGIARECKWRSFNNKTRHSCSLTRSRFTDIFPRVTRWDKNGSRAYETRQMCPSHTHFCLISCCPNESVNQALEYFLGNFEPLNQIFELKLLSQLQTICEKSIRCEKHARHKKLMRKNGAQEIMWKLTTHVSWFDYFWKIKSYPLLHEKISLSRA